PLTLKVPSGYFISGARGGDCEYVRHLGNKLVNTYDIAEFIYADRQMDSCEMVARFGNWSDNQPPLDIFIRYEYDEDWMRVVLYYYGKPAGDTRNYPIQIWWKDELLLADHRVGAQWLKDT